MAKSPLPIVSLLLTGSLLAQTPEMPPDGDPVLSTDSGLQYSVLSRSESDERPKVGDLVTAHYSGWFPDGKLFDSSVARNEPFVFTVGSGVIKGWSEGIQLMAKGDRFKFTIPYQLAYGPIGRPPVIPAKATLVFEIELLDFDSMQSDPKARIDRPDGVSYETIKRGRGDLCGDNKIYQIEYRLFGKDNRLLDGTEMSGTLLGWKQIEKAPFMPGLAALMRRDGVMRAEVPVKMFNIGNLPRHWGEYEPDDRLVWILTMKTFADKPVFPEVAEEDWTKLPSGLEYQVVEEGEGAQPVATDYVQVQYSGWLTDGTLFDTSRLSRNPSGFNLDQVISGWTEGVQRMREGSTYRFRIPAELGYGARSPTPDIPPNSTLVFEIELVQVGR